MDCLQDFSQVPRTQKLDRRYYSIKVGIYRKTKWYNIEDTETGSAHYCGCLEIPRPSDIHGLGAEERYLQSTDLEITQWLKLPTWMTSSNVSMDVSISVSMDAIYWIKIINQKIIDIWGEESEKASKKTEKSLSEREESQGSCQGRQVRNFRKRKGPQYKIPKRYQVRWKLKSHFLWCLFQNMKTEAILK